MNKLNSTLALKRKPESKIESAFKLSAITLIIFIGLVYCLSLYFSDPPLLNPSVIRQMNYIYTSDGLPVIVDIDSLK